MDQQWGSRAALQFFCSARPQGWQAHWPSSPLTGHPRSQDQNGNHQGSRDLSVPWTPTLALSGGSYLYIPRTRN
jgi:hypothetical protein